VASISCISNISNSPNNICKSQTISSFISLNENLLLNSNTKSNTKSNTQFNTNIKLASKTKTNEGDMLKLKTVTTGRKVRYTIDGKPCSDVFVRDGQTFFDCTKIRSPDGQKNELEWCYIENPKPGMKDWGYCEPIMDFDKVREYNLMEMKTITTKANEIGVDIKQNLVPAKNALDELKKHKISSAELVENIESVAKTLINLNKKMNSLLVDQELNEKFELSIKKLQFEIGKKKKQEEKQQKQTQTNCKEMLNYEESEKFGDGLIGKYYNNENWLGPYKERKDGQIDFDWTGRAPFGLNSLNFSVLWEGYILAPTRGYYYFTVTSENGVELSINDEIVHSTRQNLFTGLNSSKIDIHEQTRLRKSKKVYLSGSELAKIKIKFFRSTHLDVSDRGIINIKIEWNNEEWTGVPVNARYIYSRNEYNQLKITNYNTNDSTLNKLYENGLAFKNTDKYIIQDIPQIYVGLTQMTKISRYQSDFIKFEINTPSIVYIALLAHYPKFLPDEFEDTGFVMSLLEIDRLSYHKDHKKIIAKKSGKLLIYKKSYDKGIVNIPLKKVGINTKGIPMIMFFGFDSKLHKKQECSGKRIQITTDSKEFLSCITIIIYNINI